MSSEVVSEYVEKIKERNKDLRRLLLDFESYIRNVEKLCSFPDQIRNYTYVQEGMSFALQCAYSIIAEAKQGGGEEAAIASLMSMCNHWSCASPYSDDHWADTERAKGENSIKVKIARWLRSKAGE